MSNSTAAILSWYKDIGVNAILSDVPTNNFEEPVEKLNTKKQPTKATEAKEKPKVTKQNDEKVQPSIDSAKKANTLEELKEAIRAFDGSNLKDTATNLVFADGDPKSPIMLIGEAPGSEEDTQGLPFVGNSGKLLTTIFKTIGYDREQLYITNVIPWRPPGNRTPTPQEIAMFRPFLEKHIQLVDPKIIILVGSTAVKALLDDKDVIMTKYRGQFVNFHNSIAQKDYKAFAIYHPSFLLRSPGQKRKMWQDMLVLKEYLSNNL